MPSGASVEVERARFPAKYSASSRASCAQHGRVRRAPPVGAGRGRVRALRRTTAPVIAPCARAGEQRSQRAASGANRVASSVSVLVVIGQLRCRGERRHDRARPQVHDGVGAPRPPLFGRARACAGRGSVSPSARRTTRSPARNASGQRSARIAMYCAVHGPDAGQRGQRRAASRRRRRRARARRRRAATARASATSVRGACGGEAQRAPARAAARRRASRRSGNAAAAARRRRRRRRVERRAERRRQPAEQRARGGDRDLLADDGAHGELEAVERAGHAQPGSRRAPAAPARAAIAAGSQPRSNACRTRASTAGTTRASDGDNDDRSACARAAPADLDRARRAAVAARAIASVRAYGVARRRVSTPSIARAREERRASRPSRTAGGTRARTPAPSAARAGARASRAGATAASGSAARNSALKRRTLAKPLASATSVTGSAVSVSSRFASSSRCVCAYSIGDTPNSASKTRRRWRLVTPTRAARPSMPPSSSTPSSIRSTAACASRADASIAGVARARAPGRQRRHGRKPVDLGRRGAREEAAVLAARRAHGAHRPAIDAGRRARRRRSGRRSARRGSRARGSRRRSRASWRALCPRSADAGLAVFGPGIRDAGAADAAAASPAATPRATRLPHNRGASPRPGERPHDRRTLRAARRPARRRCARGRAPPARTRRRPTASCSPPTGSRRPSTAASTRRSPRAPTASTASTCTIRHGRPAGQRPAAARGRTARRRDGRRAAGALRGRAERAGRRDRRDVPEEPDRDHRASRA